MLDAAPNDSRDGSFLALQRHLLEDPATLQSAMETEIRAAFSRISRMPSPAGAPSGDRPPSVCLLTLMSALRPLLIRDGRILVQAAANVLRRVGDGAHGSSASGSEEESGGGSVFVTLATTQKSQGQQGQGQDRVSPGGGDKVGKKAEESRVF